MLDPKVAVRFDGDSGMSFVAGEDRSISVAYYDARSGQPIDLSGASVYVEFARAGGGVVRRTSGPITIVSSSVTPGAPGAFGATKHGLVTGDPVALTVVSGALPTPLQAATTYLVNYIDKDRFSLADTSGNPLTVLSAGTGSFALSNGSDFAVSQATAGLCSLVLRAAVTNALETGLGQNFEVGYSLAGKTRIVALEGLLDVYSQPQA